MTWVDYIEVLGTPVAALIALVSALAVASWQAGANRARDDRLREEDSKSLARALEAEVNMTQARVNQMQREVQNAGSAGLALFKSQPIFPKGVYDASLPRLGLLHAEIAARVVHYYTNLFLLESLFAAFKAASDSEEASRAQVEVMGASLGVQIKGDTLKKYLSVFAQDPKRWQPDPPADATDEPADT